MKLLDNIIADFRAGFLASVRQPPVEQEYTVINDLDALEPEQTDDYYLDPQEAKLYA